MTRGTVLVLLLVLLGCAPRPVAEDRLAFEVELPSEGLTDGATSAPVSIVEFGSFRCPYCREFQDSAFGALSRTHIAPGAARFRFVSIDTLEPYLRLSAWTSCQARSAGLDAALREAFKVLDGATGDSFPFAQASPSSQQQELCLQAHLTARRGDAQAAQRLGVRRVPTFLIGIEKPSGHVVGWVVEGLRDSVLEQTIVAVQRRVLTGGREEEENP